MSRSKDAKVHFVMAMDDDFNTCKALGEVFELVAYMNTETGGKTLSLTDVPVVKGAMELIIELMGVFGIDISAAAAGAGTGAGAADGSGGLPPEVVALAARLAGFAGDDASAAVDALLAARTEARRAKDWGRADAIRDGMAELGFRIEDTPQGPRATLG